MIFDKILSVSVGYGYLALGGRARESTMEGAARCGGGMGGYLR